MVLEFFKYHGAGNDFIMLDATQTPLSLTTEQIAFLCDRHFGIGADGLMLLQPSETYDFKMQYFNADGKEGSMCGNGGRCIVGFARQRQIINGDYTLFEAIDGTHEAYILSPKKIKLKMGDVNTIKKIASDFYFLNTGSPHAVIFTNNLNTIDITTEGRRIRYDKQFEGGTNVNFFANQNGQFKMLTYERGVEAETLACGTGTVATALVAHTHLGTPSPITLEAKGGTLRVSFEKNDNGFQNIWLEGPIQFVFSGNIEL